MALLTVQGNRLIQVLIISAAIVALFLTFNSFGPENVSGHGKVAEGPNRNAAQQKKKKPPQEMKPANATLDFQEIIYLSMPYRTDRQDALSLIASVAGLKLTMMPGVSSLAVLASR